MQKTEEYHMNRKCTLLLAATFSAVTLLGSARAEDVQEQLKKLEMDRSAAIVKGDIATLEKQTSDDYSLINMNGKMSDKSQMVNAFKTGQSKLTADDVSDLKVRVYGNTAVITGKADVKGTLAGNDATGQYMFTRVYVKKGGQWQSVAFQQTRISNP
jgi:ketosteroid isomerase-like protein